MKNHIVLIVSLAAAVAGAACARPAPAPNANAAASAAAAPVPEAVVQPGAPGQASTVVADKKVPAFNDPAYTAADVSFMQGMIHHHMQALEMVAMIPSHTTNPDLRLLGEKIRISQTDDIQAMKAWLNQRGQAIPAAMPGMGMMLNGQAMAPMAGMLTPAQMQALDAARGPAFDQLFLTGMIQHHTGALQMVADLRSHPGSGLEPNIADFATQVDTDQRMEIDRMKGLLGRPIQ
ncbi:MAG TPA: DUF305 domain-containing protein [Terriglobales bacterium]|nr:DUF305 domain-containing protein [Terriglobales bacterium]